MKPICLSLVLGVGLMAAGAAWAGEPDEGRQEEIVATVQNVCAGCHGVDLTGGVGPALTPEALQGKDAAMLAETILNGRPDTQMVSFAAMFSADDAEWLARKLKDGIDQ